MRKVMEKRFPSIDEYINEQRLNEGVEELKAQDAIKGVMFKLKKVLEPVLKKAKEKEFIHIFKIDITPCNSGFELKTNIRTNWKFDRKTTDENIKVLDILSTIYGIHMYPSSFFQSDIDEGIPAKLEGRLIKVNSGDKEYESYRVSNKAEIKKAIDDYYKTVSDQIAQIEKMMQ